MSYIADVASLPEWITVKWLLDFMDGVHPGFDRGLTMKYLERTDVTASHKVAALSKGMKTQLHLALIMGVDTRLLVLDEPTLGLDIIFRTEFYDTLVNEYFDANRSILVTTHQVEEIEQYLSRVMFIHQGRILFDMTREEIASTFKRLSVAEGQLEQAKALGPIHSRPVGEKHVLIYENPSVDALSQVGQVDAPGLADLFVAKVKGVSGE